MPYIGNTPALDYISFAVQNFTVTAGTTVYTLDYSVSNENDIALYINSVAQRPGASFAYSATGTTLTLTSATLVTDTMYAVFIGRAVQTVVPPANINLQLADGTAAAPSLNFANDTNTGIFRPTTDSIGFAEGGTEAMRITSDGRLGIGTTTPVAPLEVHGTGTINHRYTGSASSILFGQFNATGDASINNQATSGVLIFGTNNTEAMRIDSNGSFFFGKTSTNLATVGAEIVTGGTTAPFIACTNTGGATNLALLRLNRQTDDGTLVDFRHANSLEGTISVSGATVSYNGFTGSHWSRFIDDSNPDILRGTVMESLDQMVDWYAVEFETSYTEKDADGNDVVKTVTNKKPYALKANENEGDVITYAWNTEKKDEDDNDIIEQVQATIVKEKDVKHVMSKISDTVEAKNVYGVFSAWDNDDLINNDFYVASVGSYVVRIKAGQTVSKGDLLQSNGDGTAKVQADDLVRASSFAKVLSNTVIETYEDGSFIVPCSLMC
jgi:hypothetical protein